MHRDTAAGELAGPYGLDEATGLELELPQAAIITAKLTAATAINHTRRWLPGSDDPAAWSVRLFVRTEPLYRGRRYTAVTSPPSITW
jgi:hypothetical protein